MEVLSRVESFLYITRPFLYSQSHHGSKPSPNLLSWIITSVNRLQVGGGGVRSEPRGLAIAHLDHLHHPIRALAQRGGLRRRNKNEFERGATPRAFLHSFLPPFTFTPPPHPPYTHNPPAHTAVPSIHARILFLSLLAAAKLIVISWMLALSCTDWWRFLDASSRKRRREGFGLNTSYPGRNPKYRVLG